MKQQLRTKQIVVKLSREQKAKLILEGRGVTQIDRYSFKVKSQQNELVEYGVYLNGVRFCECKDHELTQADCKHIMAVEEYKSQIVQLGMLQQRQRQTKPVVYKIGVVV